jgi:hypothetical protein
MKRTVEGKRDKEVDIRGGENDMRSSQKRLGNEDKNKKK